MTSPLDTASPQTAMVGGASFPVAVKATPAPATSASPDKKGDFTFHDLLETVNPLQHLPLVGPIYRALTGDSISPAARIAGDTLYGGVFGLAGSVVDSLVEGETGKDIGSHIIATLFGSNADESTASQTVSADSGDNGLAVPATAPATSASPLSAPVTATLPAAAPSSTGATPGLSAANPASTAAAITGPKQPSDFFMAQQKGTHGSHGVALTTTVPTGDSRRPDQKAVDAKKVEDALSAAAQSAKSSPTAPAATGSPASPATAAPLPPPSVQNVTPPTSLLPPVSSNSSSAGTPVAQASIPDLMMKALEQYKSLDRQRAQPAQALPTNLIN